MGCTYSRYADDVTFSSDDASLKVGKLIFMARKIVEAEGFVIHPKKTKVMRDGMRKEVTGVVVNEKLRWIVRHYELFPCVAASN